MQQFKKKPVTVEAVQYNRDNCIEIIEWMIESGLPHTHVEIGRSLFGDPFISILTLEGTMTAAPGDGIIRGVQGEFYPCKPDIFHATYNSVVDVTSLEDSLLHVIASHVDEACWDARGTYGHDDNGLDDPVDIHRRELEDDHDEGFHLAAVKQAEAIRDAVDERVGTILADMLPAFGMACIDEIGMPVDAEDLDLDFDNLVSEFLNELAMALR